MSDMGSYPTHKAIIVRLYLQGLTTPDIAARTYHSKEAVDRYIRGFERVRLLAAKHPREELPLLTGMAPRVVDQYLELLDEHLAARRPDRRRHHVSS
jgi:transposase